LAEIKQDRMLPFQEAEANAQLISAAPKMYEYLVEHIEFLSEMMSRAQTEEQIAQIQGEIYGAEQALAKAEGK